MGRLRDYEMKNWMGIEEGETADGDAELHTAAPVVLEISCRILKKKRNSMDLETKISLT